MKPTFVSALALLFCCGVCAIVVIFGYTRYKAAQVENAEFLQRQNQVFRSQVRSGTPPPPGVLAAHMPGQLPQRAGAAGEIGQPPTPSAP